MRPRLQYTEEPSQYFERLWQVPRASLMDLMRIYELNKDIWKYRHFMYWLKTNYRYTLTYSKWYGFMKYCKYYNKRKERKIPKNMRVGKQFFN